MADPCVYYAVMISRAECFIVHSIHKDKTTAEQWAKCLAHDGSNETSLARVDSDTLRDFANEQGWCE